MKKYLTGEMISLVALLLVTAIALTTASFAWYSGLKNVNPDLSFSAGGPKDYTLYKITCANDSTTPTITETDHIGTDGFVASDLQFGKISNLGMLDNSNFIYYAIKIPKENGELVKLGVGYGDTESDGEHFKIYLPVRDGEGHLTYNDDGSIATSLLTDVDTLASLKALETESATFLSYRIALTDTAPENIGDINALNAIFGDTVYNLNPINIIQ